MNDGTAATRAGESALDQSERQFHLLVDAVRDFAIFMLDVTGHVKSWNAGAEHLKGYAAPEILGRHFSTFYTEDARNAEEPMLSLAFARTYGRYETESLRVRKDGSTFWAHVVINPMHDEHRALVGYCKVTHDVTARRLAEDRRGLLDALFEHNPDAIVVVNAKGRIVNVNGRALALFGYSRKALLDRLIETLLPERFRGRHVLQRDSFFAGPQMREMGKGLRLYGARSDGSEFPVDVHIGPVQIENETLGIAIVRDISERREAEDRRLLLATVFDYCPDGILVVDAEGRIVNSNRRIDALFGYTRQALLGQRVDMLLPERFRGGHVEKREDFFRNPIPREMGHGLDLFGCRADGTEFPVDIQLGPVPLGTGTMAIAIVRDITERKAAAEAIAESRRQRAILEEQTRASEALQATTETLTTIIEASPLAIFATDANDIVSIWNPAAERIYGLQAAKVVGQPRQRVADMVAAPDAADSRALVDRVNREGGFHNVEYTRRRTDGASIVLNASAAPLRDSAGRPNGVVFITDDITGRKATEEALRQAQKMEAVGQLTGGMAHDFNNLLGIIIGNLDLLLPMLGERAEPRELFDDALDAAMRGAELTRALLAFSRRQPLAPRRVELNDLVGGMVKLLGRTLGEDIEISLELAPDLWPVVVDPAQLEASLVNLATNARDAMPSGGRLMVATGNRRLDADEGLGTPELIPGDYVMLEVGDNGTGMPAETKQKIFDPFFTTKPRDKGTGLGLSMVFGFVKQSDGHIHVYSEVGVGTVFRLYLPRASHAAKPAEMPTVIDAAQAAGETVLAVEDNAAMRRVVVRQLEDLGYRVLAAKSAQEALDILAKEKIDLLLTDVVMPGAIDGFGLARRVLRTWPNIKVVLSSGFPETRVANDLSLLPSSVRLLSKPYRKDELARMVRGMLES